MPCFVVLGRISNVVIVTSSARVRTPLCINSDRGCTFLTILGSDDDNTIGTTCTVKGSRSCILQYSHRCNILWVDRVHISIKRSTIYNNQRLAISVNRTDTTNTNLEICNTWLASSRIDLDTRYLTCQGLYWV